MNDKAHTLGLSGTHFANPNGLDTPGHYATARDLATLAAYAMENPIFHQTVSTKSVKIGQRYLTNHNKLLWRVEGADGVKTGYTRAAGRILVSSATRNGRRLICATINAPDDWNDHSRLLEQGFSEFQLRNLVRKGQIMGTVEIAGGQTGRANLLAAEDFDYALADEEKITTEIVGPGFVYAPVVSGGEAGFVHLCIDGKSVGKIPLIYGETIEQIPEKEKKFWERMIGRD